MFRKADAQRPGAFATLGHKALQLATGDPHAQSASWHLIAESLKARNRNEALMRLRRALDEFIVDGIDTTIPLFQTLVRNADIQNGLYDIHWLERFLALGGMDEEPA